MNRIRSSLARFQASSMDKEKVKQDGWRHQGILVIDVQSQELNDFERQFVENIGTKVYGRRAGK